MSGLPWWSRWLLPFLFAATCFFFQLVLLHIATYYYIIYIDRLRKNIAHEAGDDGTGESLSSSARAGSLHDVVADWLGEKQEIDMHSLDIVSSSLPLFALIFIVRAHDLRLWTKFMLCGALLAIGKGVCGVVTIVPDSAGWEGCKARLQEAGVAFFREGDLGDENKLNFDVSFSDSVKDFIALTIGEAFGFGGEGLRIRYCADMIYSGHTWTTSLGALALYDVLHKRTRAWANRHVIRSVVGTALALYIGLDIVLILLNRFHYTIDVLLAVALALLVYTNAAVALTVDWWCRGYQRPNADEVEDDPPVTFLLPPCCVPFCCMEGRYTLTPVEGEQSWFGSDDGYEHAGQQSMPLAQD